MPLKTFGYPFRKSNPTKQKIGKTGEQAARVWLEKTGAVVYKQRDVVFGDKEYQGLFAVEKLSETKKKILSEIEDKLNRKLSRLEAYFLAGGRANRKFLEEFEQNIGRTLSEEEDVFVGQPLADFFVIFSNKTFGWVEVKATISKRKMPSVFSGNRQTAIFNLMKMTKFPLFILRVYLTGKEPMFELFRWN